VGGGHHPVRPERRKALTTSRLSNEAAGARSKPLILCHLRSWLAALQRHLDTSLCRPTRDAITFPTVGAVVLVALMASASPSNRRPRRSDSRDRSSTETTVCLC
jgi:hypothetical protein